MTIDLRSAGAAEFEEGISWHVFLWPSSWPVAARPWALESRAVFGPGARRSAGRAFWLQTSH